jgi:cyclophilin family peptidyl-prolyl cis-trans isomerase
MLNWFARRRQIKQKQTKKLASSFRPKVEGLEDRTLLSITFPAIGNQTIPEGKTLILPLSATSSSGNAITYTISSSDPNITFQQHTGNPFFKISVAGFGDMTFQLFQDLTPQTVGTFTQFIKSGFFNNLTFHRVVPGFVIQGGDPAGNGTGGPGFTYDDEFNASAIFSGNGQLALANAGKDDNGSQFFVTLGAQRALDFNHVIFGQLVKGFDVLNAIDNAPNSGAPNNTPNSPIVITSAELIPDTTDAVVTFSSAATFTGTATITVTANDGTSTPAVQTFQMQSVSDGTFNDPPILGPVSDTVTTAGTPVTLNLSATDLDNEHLTFQVTEQDSTSNATIGAINQTSNNTATVTITPNAGFTGPIHLLIGVKDPNATNRNEDANSPNPNPFDTQHITIGVGDQALSPQTLTSNPQATEGAAVTNAVVAKFTDADTTAVATDFTVTVNWGEGDLSNPPAPLTQGVVVTKDTTTGVFTVTATKPTAYREAGIFTVKVDVTDKLGATTKISTQLAVADAALSNAQGIPVSGTQGLALNNVPVATFTDANPNAKTTDFNALITWGDGTSTAGAISQRADKSFQVSGSHTYNTSGSKSISIDVSDSTPVSDVPGSKISASTTATISQASNQLFVTKLYHDLLGRDPDPQGLNYFTTILDRNLVNRFQVTLAIETSIEGRMDQIQNLDRSLLGRNATEAEINAGLAYFGHGGQLANLRIALVGSQEYFVKNGGSNSGFLAAIANDALGHALDSTTQSTLMAQLDGGIDRTLFANQFFHLLEAEHHRVDIYFTQLLQRTVDPSGNQTYSTALSQGVTEEVLIMVIGGSDEFFGK